MKREHILIGLLIAICWAGNMIASKVAVQYLPPFLTAALRFSIVAICVLPFSYKMNTPIKKAFCLAQVWGILYFSLFYIGLLLGIDASAACIILQFAVPFTAIVEIFGLRKRPSYRVILGIFASMIGLYVMKDSPNITNNFAGFIFSLLAAVAWACSSFLIKANGEKNTLTLIAWMSLLAVPGFLFLASISEHIALIPNEFEYAAEHFKFNYQFISSMLYMVLVATITVQTLWVYMLNHNEASQVMTFMLLVPVFGIILSSILLNEVITREVVLGAAIIITGMTLILVNLKQIMNIKTKKLAPVLIIVSFFIANGDIPREAAIGIMTIVTGLALILVNPKRIINERKNKQKK